MTSPDLEGLKKLINEAAHQKASLQSDWLEAVSARKKAWKKLRRREQLPLRLFMKQAIPKAREAFDEAENEAKKVAEALAASDIKVEVVLDDRCWAAWSRLEQAHRRLSNSARFWDVTSSLVVDRFRTRSAASFEVTRTLVGLRPITDGILSGPHRGMRFENANGDDLDIFPGFLLIRQKQGTDYALVDLRDLDARSYPQQFIEAEGVPPDARVVGHAWAKSNKDGSPDRRFRDNHQIPIALYGRIEFATSSGVREAYDASDCEAALEFGEALRTLQAELRRHASDPGPVQVASPVDRSSSDRAIALPALPDVWPAYEALLIPLAVVGAMAIPFSVSRPVVGPAVSSITSPPSPAALSAPVEETTTMTQPPVPPPEGNTTIVKSPQSAKREPAGLGEPMSLAPTPSDVRGSTSEPVMKRMVTTTGANVRAEPDRGAPSTRVVAAGTSVVVLDKKNGWVRVGSSTSEPWGWIHSSLLAAAP
ncbi:MAG: SH3 domain-containing protein [Phyllobacteriaceae bacterium]|nr:SH3 domain-containing protein [Phyllobacteriaceae bacterium]